MILFKMGQDTYTCWKKMVSIKSTSTMGDR